MIGFARSSLSTDMGPAAKTVTVSLASPRSAEPSSTGYVLPTLYYKGFLLQKGLQIGFENVYSEGLRM